MRLFGYIVLSLEFLYNFIVIISIIYNLFFRKDNFVTAIKIENGIIIQLAIMGFIFVVIALIYLLLDDYILR